MYNLSRFQLLFGIMLGIVVGMVIRLNVDVPRIANEVSALRARFLTASFDEAAGNLLNNSNVSLVVGGGADVGYGVPADNAMNCHIAGSNNQTMDHEGVSLCVSAYDPLGSGTETFYSKYSYTGSPFTAAVAQSFSTLKNLALSGARKNAQSFCDYDGRKFKETSMKALTEAELKAVPGLRNTSFVKVYGTCVGIPRNHSGVTGGHSPTSLITPQKPAHNSPEHSPTTLYH